MYDILIKIFIVILVVSTFFIGVKQPKMHNGIHIYDSSYTLISEEKPKPETKKEQTEIKRVPSGDTQKTAIKTEKTIKEIPVQKKEVQKTQQTSSIKEIKTSEIKTSSNPQQVEKKTVNQEIKTVEKKDTPKTQTVKQEEKTITKTEQQRAIEEEIAWNKWRSDLQNSIMKDTKLPDIPEGVLFKFTFTVDKYGRISNISTYSEPSKYTPYAIEYIAPVIRSYQGKSILEFPKNSKRDVAYFVGGWIMSKNTIYSKPSDYNDIEKIKRKCTEVRQK